ESSIDFFTNHVKHCEVRGPGRTVVLPQNKVILNVRGGETVCRKLPGLNGWRFAAKPKVTVRSESGERASADVVVGVVFGIHVFARKTIVWVAAGKVRVSAGGSTRTVAAGDEVVVRRRHRPDRPRAFVATPREEAAVQSLELDTAPTTGADAGNALRRA